MEICPIQEINMENSSNPNDSDEFRHAPVLLREVIATLAPQAGELFVDGTMGGGGHTEALLKAGAHVIALDQDSDALNSTSQRLAEYGDAFHPVKANFRDLATVLSDLEISQIDGLLLDIGVSSHQINTARRGFSFQAEGPLDMRMDQSGKITAADIINSASQDELIHIFRKYGEEPSAAGIARHIVKRRESQPFQTTSDLADAVELVKPRRGKKHPATQIFQALRIAVNDELGALESILTTAPAFLKTGGRFGVITFHSLEDRLIKNNFRALSLATLDRPEWPAPRANPACLYQLINRKSITASSEEISVNPRARSARLRVAKKIKEGSYVS